MTSASDVAPLVDLLRMQVRHVAPVQRVGAVTSMVGLIIESEGPNVGLGDLCLVRSPRNEFSVRAEVVGDDLDPGAGDRVVILLRCVLVRADVTDPAADLADGLGHAIALDGQEGQVDVLAVPELPGRAGWF